MGKVLPMHLTIREQRQLYIAVVAEVTARLMQGKQHREEREATAHEAHERGLAAVLKAKTTTRRARKS